MDIEVLKELIERLNQEGLRCKSKILAKIDDKDILEIHMLCHEIYSFITDNEVSISDQNMNALRSLYSRSGALYETRIALDKKLVSDKNERIQYNDELLALIEDVTGITLAGIAMLWVTAEVFLYNSMPLS